MYRRTLSSSPENRKPNLSSISRLARTPPSTFLFLHLHLSNSPALRTRFFRSEVSSPPSVAGSLEPGCPAAQPIHRTKNDNRQLIGCSSLITMRSLRGAEMCQGHLVQTKGYRLPKEPMSTPLHQNLPRKSCKKSCEKSCKKIWRTGRNSARGLYACRRT